MFEIDLLLHDESGEITRVGDAIAVSVLVLGCAMTLVPSRPIQETYILDSGALFTSEVHFCFEKASPQKHSYPQGVSRWFSTVTTIVLVSLDPV